MPASHAYWMKQAINEAKLAEEQLEVPIGAIIVWNDQIIGRGYNLRECSLDSTAHAELIAIKQANRTLSSWRLTDATLYVTLEPCPMCAGAILQSRIKKLVFGALDPKAGCAGSLYNLLQDQRFNHQVEVINGVLQEECSLLLKNFFKKLRKK